MVLDSSAIAAIFLKEPGHERLIEAIESATAVFIGAPTLLECGVVLTARLSRDVRPKLSSFLRHIQAEVIPFNEDHWDAAMTAYVRFGKGRHKAKLNFGDCCSYAVVSVAGMPLLFVGDDFTKTGIDAA